MSRPDLLPRAVGTATLHRGPGTAASCSPVVKSGVIPFTPQASSSGQSRHRTWLGHIPERQQAAITVWSGGPDLETHACTSKCLTCCRGPPHHRSTPACLVPILVLKPVPSNSTIRSNHNSFITPQSMRGGQGTACYSQFSSPTWALNTRYQQAYWQRPLPAEPSC